MESCSVRTTSEAMGIGANGKPPNRFPRICVLTETYYPVVGGGERQAQILAEDLVANGFKAVIVTRRSSQLLKKTETVGGVMVYRIPPAGLGRSKRWLLLLSSFGVLAQMRRQYDIIFVSGFKALGISAVLISKLFGKVCILKADSNGEMSGEFFAGGLKKLGMTPASLVFRIFLAVRNSILRHADYFVAITSGIAEELRGQGVNPGIIRSVTNGVDTKEFSPVGGREKYELRRQLGIPNKDRIITYTGRLVTYKGLPLLMRVSERIQREHKNVGFVLVGSGGLDMHNCEAEIKKYVISNALEASVHFAGEVCNVHEYLQASDIFVLPTEEDAFPLALIEAMACGLPVVSTPVGGIEEIITHRENGLVVETGNFQQLYDALHSLITDTSLSASLGRAAVRTVQNRYSRETIANKYIELFGSAAS
jgi:glycosyltransferase involved in cell wall biosynthesis